MLAIVAVVVGSRLAAAEPGGGLARVRVLATGGTIAGAQASATGYGYKSGASDVTALLSAVPNLDKLAAITGEQVARIGSQDMHDEVWLRLAKHVNDVLKARDVDAALITHGTDTLEETAYFLSLVLFVLSILLMSQAATIVPLAPVAAAIGLPAPTLLGMYPALNGTFFLPTYGTVLAAVSMDPTGTTRIGKYLLNHSFMLPGLVSTGASTATALALSALLVQ